MTIADFTPILMGSMLIFLGLVMAGTRAGYWLFVVGVKSVLIMAAAIAAFVWYVSSAHAEEDHRTIAEKAFCAGIEIQRMTARINITEIQDALKADGNRLYVMYGPEIVSKILGTDYDGCSGKDVAFAPGMGK
jgi:hypothetical protein